MMVILEAEALEENIRRVQDAVKAAGGDSHVFRGSQRTTVVVVGEVAEEDIKVIEYMPQVLKVVPILQPFKLSGREAHPEDSLVKVAEVTIGGSEPVLIAGPCAVENEEQLLRAAEEVQRAGAHILRGGAFKPRTSPYSFQGLAEEGLKLLAKAREVTGLPVVTEVITAEDVPLVAEYSDMLQIGARNMQNYALLRAVGRSSRPVLLKRGLAATIEEWLMAAEYIMSGGNYGVVLCERGIRTHEPFTRNTLDVAAIAAVRQLSHLPVLVDPSHASGKARLVEPLARAGIATGAHGVMVEVHPEPGRALSDGAQSLTPDEFAGFAGRLTRLARMLKEVEL